MDLDILINAVREQKLLWNKKHKDYRNRLLTRRAWKCVADGLGCTSEDAQKKWKNLRDSFARELKKIPKRRSGADAEDGSGQYKGDWPYFEAMKFLEIVVKPRKIATNIPTVLLDESYILDDTIMSVLSDSTGITGTETTDTITENIMNYNITPGINQSIADTAIPCDDQSSADVGKKKKKPLDFSEVFMDIEREKIMLLKKDMDVEDDEDMNWFKSIKPYIKKLPPLNKLLFRTTVQEILLSELSKLETPSHTQSSSSSHIPSNTISCYNENCSSQ